MDEFTRIQTFIKVVEAGSFSAAARHDLSISSVARQVKALEDELGVRLLNRSTRRLSLTEPGRAFYERASVIARDLSSAKSEARSHQDDVKGTLRVSIRVSAATPIIVPALPVFLEQHSQLSIDVSLSDERVDLIANGIDVAVWMGLLPDSEIVARRLSPSRRIVCGAPAYFQRHEVPRTPADLRRHNCVLFSARSYGNVWGFERAGKREEVEVRGNLRSSNALVLHSAAIAGLGVIVVHEWMVRLDLSQGRLVRVLADYTVNPTEGEAELYAVYPSRTGVSRKVKAFLEFLARLFEDPELVLSNEV